MKFFECQVQEQFGKEYYFTFLKERLMLFSN